MDGEGRVVWVEAAVDSSTALTKCRFGNGIALGRSGGGTVTTGIPPLLPFQVYSRSACWLGLHGLLEWLCLGVQYHETEIHGRHIPVYP